MSKVIYGEREFRITRAEHGGAFNIVDNEGYMHLTNIAPEKLNIYRKAAELSNKTEPKFKIITDFAPYATNEHTLKNNKLYHSLWIKSGYHHEDLHAFWSDLDILKRHPSALNL